LRRDRNIFTLVDFAANRRDNQVSCVDRPVWGEAKMRWPRIALWIVPFVFMLAAARAGDLPRELLDNGSFEREAPGRHWPDGWPRHPAAQWFLEDGNHFLRLQARQPGDTVSISRTVALQPDWGVLRVSCGVRYRDIVPGREGWHDGRIAMSFLDAEGRRVGPWPNVLHWQGTADTWRGESREFVIPEGAAQLAWSLSLFSVQSGRLDLDDVQITVLRHRPKPEDAALPDTWKAALAAAVLEESPVRDCWSLNGAWQFRPMGLGKDEPGALTPALAGNPPPLPASPGWGWTKLPSVWPGTYGDSHQPVVPDFWALRMPPKNAQAYWYRRTVEIPAGWRGRRIVLGIDMPQTQAGVLVDGRLVGQVRWPSGRVDLTAVVHPGKPAAIALWTTALPFEPSQMVAMREDMIAEAKSQIRFHGICGDVLLWAKPQGARIADVQFRPSVRQRQLGLRIALADAAGRRVRVGVEAAYRGAIEKQWTSPAATVGPQGTLELTVPWLARHLWDLDAPHLYDVRLTLTSADGRALDEVRQRFGFREMALAGRDVLLNGTRIHWRALDFSNHLRSLAGVSKAQCLATFQRMRSLGFNFVILANYGVDPGETAAFDGLLEAADESGFLLSFTLPHPLRSLKGYDAKRGTSPDWQRLADYCIRMAENHPSVLAYAMSHNTLGYHGDQNPAKMDGLYQPKPPKPDRKRETAAAAEAYVRRQDPTRTVYHHQSGNMGAWHTVNIYLNWAPIQERMDWLSHWAVDGVKPMFFVEYGLPHVASWGRHRVGPFIWRNLVSSEPLAVEYGAAITGDRAYDLTEAEERHIDNYERIYAAGKPFHITSVLGDYWHEGREHNHLEIQSAFTEKIWPALRTWGLTAVLPWDQDGVARAVSKSDQPTPIHEPPEQWTARGVHPDFVPPGGDYFIAANAGDFELTSLGRTFQRVNRDVLAWIAGSPRHFTEQGHVFRSGETVEKQVIVVNDRRAGVQGECVVRVLVGCEEIRRLSFAVRVGAGDQQRLPIKFEVPQTMESSARIQMVLSLTDGLRLDDRLPLRILPQAVLDSPPEVLLWDPKGLTTKELARLGVHLPRLAGAIPVAARALVVGREAISVDGPLPDVGELLARGGRVLVFEQTEAALSRRLGFRTNQPSLRNVFLRSEHPALAGIDNELLRDWRGQSTLTADHYELPDYETTDPMEDWLGFKNTRVWKWGNWGQVASVVIEKPQTGDFTALADGGFDLQYSPLLLMRTPAGGQMLFCQLDVTGRSAPDPAADRVAWNLLNWAFELPVSWERGVNAAGKFHWPSQYVGDEATRRFLESLGARFDPQITNEVFARVRVVGPGADLQQFWSRTRPGVSPRVVRDVFLFQAYGDLIQFWRAMLARSEKITHTELRDADRRQMPGIGPAELHFRSRVEIVGALPQGWSTQTGTLARSVGLGSEWFFCQVDPRRFDYTGPNKIYLKLTHNHTCTLLSRFLANAGVPMESRLPEYWATPVPGKAEPDQARWLHSYYLDTPVANDDPYRYNRW
jgi:hypothetical protein